MRRRIRSAAIPVHRHSLPQLGVDGVLVALAWYLAFKLRFDGGVPVRYSDLFDRTVVPLVVIALVIFAVSRLYTKWWRFFGRHDYRALFGAVVIATLALEAYIAIVHPVKLTGRGGEIAVTAPGGVVAAFFLIALALTAGVRLLVSEVLERPVRGFTASRNARDVLIVGAGQGGQLVLREILRNPQLGFRPIGFADDDPRKSGLRLENGVRVLGRTDELPRILDEVEPDEVLLAIPSAPGDLRKRVVAACRDRNIPVRTLPTVFELLQTGPNVMRQVRDIRVEDVLGREPIRVELERVGGYLTGQVVMVTGAGGSIGSELCRQIARVGPRRLVVLDHAEDNLFEIQRELEEVRHVRGVVSVLADIKEEERMREVFAEQRPAVVFHAAAYKHVGLMEANPVEAVRNNSLGTRILARVAGDSGTKAFVLVSTDKACSPATVMGASKALAEWAVEAAGTRYPETRFSSVRFGNVLGSSGSVVPIFRRQIAAGGPVTVTDAQMTRYFMTVPEAVQLVIRAGNLGEGGEVFVLDMGEPVKIVDLARDMIRLSGLEADRDVAIEIVGRRPGEKLHEELFNPFERPKPTAAEKILVAERDPLEPAWVESIFDQVNVLVLEGDAAGLADKVAELSTSRGAAGARIAR
jgi:FlaA1/EpsC-like NDP-sugar epimerase